MKRDQCDSSHETGPSGDAIRVDERYTVPLFAALMIFGLITLTPTSVAWLTDDQAPLLTKLFVLTFCPGLPFIFLIYAYRRGSYRLDIRGDEIEISPTLLADKRRYHRRDVSFEFVDDKDNEPEKLETSTHVHIYAGEDVKVRVSQYAHHYRRLIDWLAIES